MEIKETQHKHYEILYLSQYGIEIGLKKNDYVKYYWENGEIAKFTTKQILYDLFDNFKLGETKTNLKNIVQYCRYMKKKIIYKDGPKDYWYDSSDGPPSIVEKIICDEISTGKFKHILFIKHKF